MLKYLIADDERMVRLGLKLMIESLNLPIECVGEAKDGQELLELCKLTKPDLCFVDIKMPNKSGLEAIKEGREKGYDIYWIILTGFPKFEYAQEALKSGVIDYLLKPVRADDLEQTVKNVLDKVNQEDRLKEDEKLIIQNTVLQKNKDIIEEIKIYIQENYMKDISISTIAGNFGITTAYASRIFRQKTGGKFIDYLIEVRMKHAKRIIELNPNIPIREVAHMVGYYSTRYFTKIFVKTYQCYPSDLKKHLK